jgi:DNA-binding XRE family transcriptional regulator
MEKRLWQVNPDKLMRAREDAGFSREYIADKLGVSGQQVRAIEEGRSDPFAWQIGTWCELCGVAMNSVFSYEPPRFFLKRKSNRVKISLDNCNAVTA